VYGTARVAVPPPPTVTVEADVAAPPPPTATVTIQASQPEVSAGVVVMTPTCTPGAPEVLNGVDDNCNGVVDEGFVQTGAVQISLGWATGADMDLYVVDPFNEEVSYRNRTVSSSGHLDRDARGACTDGQTTENVYWPAGQAPRGTYQVAVHYFSGCNAAGPTPVTLSIMVGGRALGVYQFTIAEGQRVTMATFTIP
jgi:hypothetical protein